MRFFCNFRRGLTQQQCIDELNSSFGDEAQGPRPSEIIYCSGLLGISEANVHSILFEDLTVKKICSCWIEQNLSIAQKKTHVDWSKEMLQKYGRGASKHGYDIVDLCV